MSLSNWNKDYCPSCKEAGAGGFFTLHFISSTFSWNCPHCGALIRLNYLLLMLFFGIGIVFDVVVVSLLDWLGLLSNIIGILIAIVTVSLSMIVTIYITPRTLIRKANEI